MTSRQLKVVPSQKTFWEVTFTDLPRSVEQSFTKWLFNNGCLGTEEKLDFTQKNLKYLPTVKSKKMITMKAYFDPAARENLEWKMWQWIQLKAPTTRPRWELQETRDWLAEWKKHFKPFKLAGLQFVPKWRVSVHSKTKTVIVEPGMAFGTGTHKTTQFAIQLLQKLSTEKTFKNALVLDVGSGSGILAVCAEKMGARKIVGIDNDPEAWRESQKMFKLNKTRRCSVSKKQIDEVKEKYDVVIANIIDGVLIELKKDLWRALESKGHMILSGILTDGAKAFIKSFLKGQKVKVLAQLNDSEWTAFLIQKA